MIGSQKFVPLVSGTTDSVEGESIEQLWLALKSLYLWYLEQPFSFVHCFHLCCDWNSQKFVPWYLEQLYYPKSNCLSVVIGSQSLYFWYLEQQKTILKAVGSSCDWLSKVCTFGIWTTWNRFKKTNSWLWLALKSLYLWYLEQSIIAKSNCLSVVIGSQSLYLWYLEQQKTILKAVGSSCDWLSKVCTFGIWNNLKPF